MWYIFLLTFANAVLPHWDFVHKYRIVGPGGAPITVIDLLLGLGLLASLFRGRGDPTLGRHPMFGVLLTAFTLCTLTGLGVSLAVGNDVHYVVAKLRDFMVFPVTIYLGYRFLGSLNSCNWATRTFVLSGLLNGALLVLYFARGAGKTAEHELTDILNVRTIDFVTEYTGITLAFMLFTRFQRVSYGGILWSTLVVINCTLGTTVSLSRSDWAAGFSGLLVAAFLAPVGQRLRQVRRMIAVIPLLFGVLFVGMLITSSVTGQDVVGKMYKRVQSMLPGGNSGETTVKAWDTRLAGIQKDFELFLRNPLLGQGFGIQTSEILRTRQADSASEGHNSWTSTMAETGLLGLTTVATMFIVTWRVGRALVRDAFDRSSLRLGGLAVITCVFCAVHGATTMSWNIARGAIPIGLACGMLLRCRDLQLAAKAQWAGYLDANTQYVTDENGYPAMLQPAFDEYGQPVGYA